MREGDSWENKVRRGEERRGGECAFQATPNARFNIKSRVIPGSN
jgi:hypothetical protein